MFLFSTYFFNFSISKIYYFIQVKLSDEGDYICKCENIKGSASTTARLKVLHKMSGPCFQKALSPNINFLEGESVCLEIQAGGTPLPTVQWMKDGLPIEEMSDKCFKTKKVDNTFILSIPTAHVSKVISLKFIVLYIFHMLQ